MAQWFCQIGGQQYGPVDFPALQAWGGEGRIQPDDLVWSEGMANWQPAKTIPGLLPLAAGAPPMQQDGASPQSVPAVPVYYQPYNTYAQQHRGVAALVLGIVSLVTCWMYCIGVIPGIIGWVIAEKDLTKMKAGLMDPSGRGMAIAGKIMSMITVILTVVILVVAFAIGFFSAVIR